MRLRKTEEFRRCFNGLRAGDRHLLIFAATNQYGRTRLGVSVSRKHGNAVARNRKKRLLREAFRHLDRLPGVGLDIVLVPRQRKDSQLRDYQGSLKRLIRKLSQRLDVDRVEEAGS